jgi:hypothetical protein
MLNGLVSNAAPRASSPVPTLVWLGGLCTISAAALALVVTVTSSDTLVANAFEAAFAATAGHGSAGGPEPRLATTAFDGRAGSEEFWLRAENANGLRVLKVGQQITLNANGQARHLRITNVSDAGDAMTHIQTTLRQARVLLLTCREGDAQSGRDIALRLEAGQIIEVPLETAARVEQAL